MQNSLQRLVDIKFLESFEMKGDTFYVKKALVRIPNLKGAVTKRLL